MNGRVRRAARAVFRLLLIAGLAFAVAGCAGSSGGGATEEETSETGITTGSIGGLTFTVISGTVYQDQADGPLTAGSEGAFIVFDATGGSVEYRTDVLVMQVKVKWSDGGRVGAPAFGSLGDTFTGAIGVDVMRSGSVFSYAFRAGTGGTVDGSGVLTPNPADPDGSLYLTVQLDNSVDPPTGNIWHPEVIDPSLADCGSTSPIGSGLSFSPPGTGDRFGLGFFGATIENLSILDYFFNGC